MLVNLDAFPGLPNVKIRIVDKEGAVSIGSEGSEKFEIKVEKAWLLPGSKVAKVVVPYWGTAWGANAHIEAKAKRTDGKIALAKCKVVFREQEGPNVYEHFEYMSIGRPILGEAAGKYIYINSDPPLHRRLFGDTRESFDSALETDPAAQMRVASIVTDAVIYSVAEKKSHMGGDKGFTIGTEPVSDVRAFIEAKRFDLDLKIVRHFLKESASQ